jgi:hypothetical protein
MVKGKTKSGIKFQIDERIKDDARILYYLTALQKADIEPMEASKGEFDLLGLIFGSQENVLAFMNAVAEANDGVCDTTTMLSELTSMFEVIGAKKS